MGFFFPLRYRKGDRHYRAAAVARQCVMNENCFWKCAKSRALSQGYGRRVGSISFVDEGML